jgi:anti-anti-sigma factor
MPPLGIAKGRLNDDWVTIAVDGEVDLATADELTSAIDEVFSNGSDNLLVDLTDTSFMDSTGLKTLVMADRRFGERQRDFAIVVDGGPVSRLIDLSGIDSSIRVVSNPSEVLD